MDTKEEKTYWNMKDFRSYCGDKIIEPTKVFSEILKTLENSYEVRFNKEINLRKLFQKNGNYVFDIQGKDEEAQKESLYDILRWWEAGDRWDYRELVNLENTLVDLLRPNEKEKMGLVTESVHSYIYQEIKNATAERPGEIINTMKKKVYNLQSEYKKLDSYNADEYGHMVYFVKKFYNFVDSCEGEIEDINSGRQQEHIEHLLGKRLLGIDARKGIRKAFGDGFGEVRQIFEELSGTIRKKHEIEDIAAWSDEELGETLYQILGEIARREFRKKE